MTPDALQNRNIICPQFGIGENTEYYVLGMWFPHFQIAKLLRSVAWYGNCLESTLPRAGSSVEYRRLAFRHFGEKVDAKAHRLFYELFIGPITEGNFICHHCDNPACVLPEHLWSGTAAENSADRDRKLRAPHKQPYPEKLPEIRRLLKTGMSQSQVAKLLNISQTGVSKYIRRYGMED